MTLFKGKFVIEVYYKGKLVTAGNEGQITKEYDKTTVVIKETLGEELKAEFDFARKADNESI